MADDKKTLTNKVTLRFTKSDHFRLLKEAFFAGLPLSEIIRRRCLGGRPIIAYTDETTVRELRRLGGLLKSNFTTLREVGISREVIELQEQTLLQIIHIIDEIGLQNDSKKN